LLPTPIIPLLSVILLDDPPIIELYEPNTVLLYPPIIFLKFVTPIPGSTAFFFPLVITEYPVVAVFCLPLPINDAIPDALLLNPPETTLYVEYAVFCLPPPTLELKPAALFP
jgi:hypothetical protein